MWERFTRHFDKFSRLREVFEIAQWLWFLIGGVGALAAMTGAIDGLSPTLVLMTVLVAISISLVIAYFLPKILRERSLYGKIRISDLGPRRLVGISETGERGIEVGARIENAANRIMYIKLESGLFSLQKRINDEAKLPDEATEILPFSSIELQLPLITDINLEKVVSGKLSLSVLYGYKETRLIYRYAVDVRIDILVRPLENGTYAMEPDAKVLEATYSRVGR